MNWSGDPACTSCSPGWTGKHCQIAVISLPSLSRLEVALASVGGSGYFTTFFGVSFTHRVAGEFYLVRSKTDNFAIQLRQAPCVKANAFSPLCTTGFAIAFGKIRITLRAPVISTLRTTTTVPIVWLNGKLVRVDHVTRLSLDFRMVRISTLTYHIYGPRGLAFIVNVDQSLLVTVHVPRVYCHNSFGLLGACKDHNITNSTDVQDLIDSLIASSGVKEAGSFFVYRYSSYLEHRLVTGGGFSLYFKDSYVKSASMAFSRVTILTIELLVKIHRYGGVLLSYAHGNGVFALLNERTVKLIYKQRALDTGITLQLMEWNQISVVFKRTVGILHFYHLDSSGKLKVRVFKLDPAAFSSGGTLVFGQWQASREQDRPPSSGDFVGEIDEVRIWQRRSNPFVLRSNWQLNVQQGAYPGLLHLWKLNQVEGRVIRDLISGSHLSVVRFHEPLWAFSDANIPPVDPDFEKALSSRVRLNAQKFCFSLFLEGVLFNRCSRLGLQVAQFYYRVCLKDIYISAGFHWTMLAVVAYSDYCQVALNLSSWPARELCSEFPDQQFPYVAGPQCEALCLFGYPVPSQNGSDGIRCVCEPGYWGNDCANLCPGGIWNVCNGNGVCDAMNGTCGCDAHWRGNVTASAGRANSSSLPCSRCTEGWQGSDCSVASESQNSSRPGISINYGDPHFTTVTGESFHFEVPGAFILLNSSAVEAQILQVPCKNRVSCRKIIEVALQTAVVKLFVRYSDQDYLQARVHLYAQNSSSDLTESDEWVEAGDVKYRWPNPRILEVRVSDRVQFNILTYDGTIGAAVELVGATRELTTGLCGHEQSKWINESKAGNQQELTQKTLDDRLVRQRVTDQQNFLTTEFASMPFSGAGYMLEFHHNQLMFVGGEDAPVLSEFTFEIWVCLVNEGVSTADACADRRNSPESHLAGKHAILSTSTKTGNMAVVYDGEITVIWEGEHITRTGITVHHGVWTHVGVTWRTHDGRVQVMAARNTASYNSSTVYGVHVGRNFSFDGFLVLGRHLQGDEVLGAHDMRGALDDLRVWQYARNENEVRSLRSASLESYIDGLVLYLPLDEGTGSQAEGTIYAVLPVGPSRTNFTNSPVRATFFMQPASTSPRWVPSSVPMSPVSNYTLDFRNETLMRHAKERCYAWFYTGKIQQYCSSALVSTSRFYYESCLADIADSGNLDHYKLSVSLFGFYCQKVLGIKECLLYGTYDAFSKCPTPKKPKTNDLTPAEIAVITISVIFFVLFLLFVIIVLCRRYQKKRKERNEVEKLYLSPPQGYRYRLEDAGHEGGDILEMGAFGYIKGPLSHYESDSDSLSETPTLKTKFIRRPEGTGQQGCHRPDTIPRAQMPFGQVLHGDDSEEERESHV